MSSTTFYKVAVALVLTASVLILGTTSAQAQSAPTLEVNHATCYQSIVVTGDLFCLARYELTDSIADGVSDAWCAELFDQTGCDGSPALPDAPTSLPQNTAFITLYDNCVASDCSSGDLLNVSRVPRIGFSVGGSYVTAGHAITFGDNDVALCVESSETLFVTPAQDCQTVIWNTAATDQDSQRELLGANLVSQIFAVGIEQSKATNYYVDNNLINSVGKPLALEALANADRILDVFASGANVITVPGSTPVASSTVQANINTNTSAVQTAKTNFGTAVGLGGEATGTIVSLILVFGVTVASLAFSKNLLFSLVAGVSFASVLVIFGFLAFQVLAVLIVILALPAGVKVIKVVTQ